ncbi:MoaD/ThiS family protein [Candidatus Bathyarchaeota archaeon]|nr:MoaD/ThiS family protein [Candidatus Bathyarchaeota archaeon]
MRVKVRAFGELIPILGGELTVELDEGANISDLILKISTEKNGFYEKIKHLSSQQGVTDFGLVILLNGLNINLLEGTKTKLRDGDTIVILPPVAGGISKKLFCHL